MEIIATRACRDLANLSPAHLSVQHGARRARLCLSIAREAQHNGVGPALGDTVGKRSHLCIHRTYRLSKPDIGKLCCKLQNAVPCTCTTSQPPHIFVICQGIEL